MISQICIYWNPTKWNECRFIHISDGVNDVAKLKYEK